MNKLILSLMLLSSTLSAAWEDSWTEAVKACHDKRYEEAETLFTKAIDDLKGDPSHGHVYIDRGRLYLLLDRDEEALRDIEKGLQGGLKGDDKLRAVVSQVAVLYRLGRIDEAEEVRNDLRALLPSQPLEIYESKVIVRNVPDCPCARKLLKHYLAYMYCNSVDDVTIENGICVANRTKSCDCKSSMLCFRNKYEAFTYCEFYCDKAYKASTLWCSRHFKAFRCQAACLWTVDYLKDGCDWCCQGQGFYENCIKPFEDIVGRMGNGCDPLWD